MPVESSEQPTPGGRRHEQRPARSRGSGDRSGAGGIGEATALRLAAAGARIVLSDRVEGTTESVRHRITQLGSDAVGVVANLVRPEGAEVVIEAAIRAWGRVDILVNVVGGMRQSDVPVWELPEDAWNFTIGLNLKTTFVATKGWRRRSIKQRSGRIVNIAGVGGGSTEHAHRAPLKRASWGHPVMRGAAGALTTST